MTRLLHSYTFLAALSLGVGAISAPALAASFTVTVDGPDSIFLAGRTDLVIPATNLPWGDGNAATDDGMLRHGSPTPEEALETLPPFLAVSGGDIVRVLDPAVGGINYFNGFGPGFFGPEGNGPLTASNLTSFGGISGYKGSQGALAGVFLSNVVPSLTNGAPPPTLDFSLIGSDFLSLSPLLGQVFFIGNGQTSGGVFQQFVAPAGATRIFFGIPDGFGFVGVPGAYDDNDGSYQIRVGINEVPRPPEVPLPAGVWLMASALAGLGLMGRRKS